MTKRKENSDREKGKMKEKRGKVKNNTNFYKTRNEVKRKVEKKEKTAIIGKVRARKRKRKKKRKQDYARLEMI